MPHWLARWALNTAWLGLSAMGLLFLAKAYASRPLEVDTGDLVYRPDPAVISSGASSARSSDALPASQSSADDAEVSDSSSAPSN